MLEIIQVSAEDCGSCQIVQKYLLEIMKNHSKWIYHYYSNDKEIIKKYQILTFPTVIYLLNGSEERRFVGIKTKEDILKDIIYLENKSEESI